MQLRIDSARIALAGLLGAAGCAGEAPTEPSWTKHVRPIVNANCIRCHSAPPLGGAPRNFRLDVYDTTVTDEGDTVYGAGTMARFMALRAFDGSMPPRFPLHESQRKTIERWAASRGNGKARRGAPFEDNRPPSFALRGSLEEGVVDGRLVLDYEIDDPDLDVVLGELLVGPDLETAERVTGELHYGRGQAVWDIGVEAEGAYQLFAVLDDGSETAVTEIGSFDVAHPDGNTAPRVEVTAPTQDEIIADKDSPFDVVVTVDDPDAADAFTLTVEAFRPGETVVLADGVAAQVGENRVSFDTGLAEEGANWRIRAAVSDGQSERSDTTLPFIVGHRTTDLFFDDTAPNAPLTVLQEIFGTHCTYCHNGQFGIPEMQYNFGAYVTVNEHAGTIFRRVVQQRNMPPKSRAVEDPTSESMTAEEREILAEWLLAGAPLCETDPCE